MLSALKNGSCLLAVFCIWFFVSCHEHEKTVKVCFTGDLLLDRGVREQIEKRSLARLFEKVKPLFEKVDFVVANLECPVTKKESPINKKYIFRAEPEWLSGIRNAGITHLVMANNHSNDQGREGITDTFNNLIKNQLVPLGYGETQELACKPVIIEKAGIKIALFASVLVPLENWPYLAGSPGICQASVADLIDKIKVYKDHHTNDKVVVVLHWGAEFQTSPMASQRKEAQELIDAGADAIIGHHPHVVQNEIFYKGKPVFYSLGNFVFDQKLPVAQEAQIVQLNFSNSKTDVVIHPIKINNCVPELK